MNPRHRPRRSSCIGPAQLGGRQSLPASRRAHAGGWGASARQAGYVGVRRHAAGGRPARPRRDHAHPRGCRPRDRDRAHGAACRRSRFPSRCRRGRLRRGRTGGCPTAHWPASTIRSCRTGQQLPKWWRPCQPRRLPVPRDNARSGIRAEATGRRSGTAQVRLGNSPVDKLVEPCRDGKLGRSMRRAPTCRSVRAETSLRPSFGRGVRCGHCTCGAVRCRRDPRPRAFRR